VIKGISKLITQYPKHIIIVLGIVIVSLSYFIQYFGIDASEETLINKSDKQFVYTKKIEKKYNLKRHLIVVYKPNFTIFSDSGIALIRKLKQDLLNQPAVTNVTSILDVPLLQTAQTVSSRVRSDHKFPTLLTEGIPINMAKKDITSSPFYKNMLISNDAKTTALQLNLSHNFSKHDALGQIRAVINNYQSTGSIYLGGMDVIADDIMGFIRRDLIIFSGGVMVCMILILGWIFRHIIWIIIPIGCCTVSVVAMMGLLGLMGWKVTIISSNFISLQIILTLSLVIHLIIKYLELARQYPTATQQQLVSDTINQKIVPSLFAVLTTITGFGSLMLSDIYPVATFGWMMVLGLVMSLFITFLLFGAGLSLVSHFSVLPPAKWSKRVVSSLITVTSTHAKKLIIISVVTLILGGIGLTQLSVENSFINYFASSTDIHKGLKFIDQNLGGTTPLDIIITLPSNISANSEGASEVAISMFDEFSEFEEDQETNHSMPDDYWISQDKVDIVHKAHTYLESQPEIGKVLSLWTTIQLGEQINKGPLNAFELILLNTLIPDAYKPLLLDPYMSIADNQLRLTMRLYDSLPDMKRNELLNQIQNELPEILNIPTKSVKLTGAMVLYNNMLQALFNSQIKSLGVVVLAIMIMLLLLFRNFKLAISAIIPNLFSVVVVLGMMGLLNIPLDMMTTTIAAITIGIAIDNAIHYIYRFQKEFEIHHDYMISMKNTHDSIGTAMIYTSLAISIGFGILAFSNFIPNVMFGLLTAAAMIVALITSLTLLPLSLRILKPFKSVKK
jgi:predicted RND superfamily exporter protein